MKWVAYVLSVIGLFSLFFAETDKQMWVGAGAVLVGFLMYVVERLLDRIDPDGAEDD